MRRILRMVFWNWFRLPFFWYALCRYGRDPKAFSEEERYRILKKINGCANRAGRVTVEGKGAWNLPEEDGFLLFPNHQGLYDVLAIMEACPRPFSVVAKKEVEKIPFLRRVFAMLQAKMLDRNDIRQSMQVIQEVADEVRQGRNYLIFPEGTRSKEENKAGIFKGGSFKTALMAKCPIVPVALVDAFVPFDRKGTKPVTVQVQFLKPLKYEEYCKKKTNEIATLVREQIVQAMEAMKNTGEALSDHLENDIL